MGSKYTEAQARASEAYEARTFKKILFKFRLDEDADILRDYEDALENGIKKTEWFRGFYDGISLSKVKRVLESNGLDEETINKITVTGGLQND